MDNEKTIGSRALKTLAEFWNVSVARSRRRDDGFDWWPGDFRVSVSVSRRVDGHVPETWMLMVRTDFLKDVPINDDKVIRLCSDDFEIFNLDICLGLPDGTGMGGTRSAECEPTIVVCQHRLFDR